MQTCRCFERNALLFAVELHRLWSHDAGHHSRESHPKIRPGQSVELLKELHILTRNGARYSDSFGNTVHSDKSFELTYRYHAMPGLVLQPIAQDLLNHSSDTA